MKRKEFEQTHNREIWGGEGKKKRDPYLFSHITDTI
jgi:hypothetical protein